MKVFSFLLMLTALLNPPSGSSTNPRYISTVDSLQVVEKVYLHTDRDSYYPGDDIWFKAYLIDATDRLLTSHSYNLHVELISPDSKIIDSRTVRLNEGLGNGDFRLPDTIMSGQYKLRAYTNYMRNFSDQLFFNKNITIINPKDAAKVLSDSSDYVRNKLEISFFPEGGSLVDDVPSNVAFKAVNAIGKGCDVSGEIYSSTGEKVTEFKSTHKGMGTFNMTSVSGLNYYAIAKDPYNDKVKIEIPKSYPTGVVLNVSVIKRNKLVLTVRTNRETLPLIHDRDLLLTVSARNKVFKTVSFRMESLNSYFNLATDDLPDDIVMLTLSGLNNIPLCERLIYLQNNEDIKIQLETNKTVYNKRDSVSVKINLSYSSRIEREAFLSLSATGNIFVNNSSPFPSTISSWFLLESDVRGPVEEPSYYFDLSNPNRLRDLDLLLLTQGWRDFEWKYQTMVYPPEYGFAVSGRVRKKFADVPIKNSSVNIGIFHSGKPLISVVPTDSSGRFFLKGVDLSGDAKLIASAAGKENKLQGWLLLDSLRYLPPEVPKNTIRKRLLSSEINPVNDNQFIDDNQPLMKISRFIQYAEVKNSIQKKYKLSDTIKPGEVNIIAKREDTPESALSRAERYLGTLFIDQTTVITPELEKYGSLQQLMTVKFHFYSIGGEMLNQQGSPLFLIDGMEVGYDEIASLPVSLIERIDIVFNAYGMYGERGKYGAISYTTKNNWGSTHAPYYHSANIKFSGYNEPRIFYSPKHHTTLESDYKPDLRTTLFWEPNIRLKNNENLFLNYYNADNSSVIRVTVEGITKDGIPITAKTEYQVQ
jgi:hypothetical protein